MQKLSAIITTYNEQHNISDVIDSLRFADEILVVDSFSTDNTLKLAKACGATVLQHTYETPALQKNWIIPQAKYNWVLLLDADERVTPELANEIKSTLENPVKDAYWIFRRNSFMGRVMKHSGIQGDKVVRLFKRDTCRYNQNFVHEEIELKGLKVGFLKNRMLHNTYTTLNAFYEKMNRYADWQALDYKDKTGHVTFYHLLLKPAFRFCKHYIFGAGFLDGFQGFVYAKTQAYAVQMRYVKLKQIQKNLKDG